jgi:hypothetical protein
LRTVLWILAALAALFVAYVVGRAAGILLGIGPHPTEAAAIALVLAVVVWKAAQRGNR